MIYMCPYCRVGKKENKIIMIPTDKDGFRPMCIDCFKKFKKERKAIGGIK